MKLLKVTAWIIVALLFIWCALAWDHARSCYRWPLAIMKCEP